LLVAIAFHNTSGLSQPSRHRGALRRIEPVQERREMFGARADPRKPAEILGHERRCETLPGRGVATARQEDAVRRAAQVFDASLTLLDDILNRDQRRNVSDDRQPARSRRLRDLRVCLARQPLVNLDGHPARGRNPIDDRRDGATIGHRHVKRDGQRGGRIQRRPDVPDARSG
jgi:hypothetical protein